MATTLGALWIHISNILTNNGVSLKDLQKLQQTWYDEIGKNEATTLDDHGCAKGWGWNGTTCVPNVGNRSLSNG